MTLLNEIYSLLAHGTGHDEGGGLAKILGWLGRFHILLIHFPIALILVAFGAQLASRKWPRSGFGPMAGWCATIGAAGAVAAAGTGWLYAEFGGHAAGGGGFLFWHRWLGVGVALLSSAAAFLWWKARRNRGRGETADAGGSGPGPAFLILLALASVLVGVAAHLGGSMVYGGDFLLP